MGWLLYISVILITIGNIMGYKTDMPRVLNIIGLLLAGVGYILLSHYTKLLDEKIKELERKIK